MKVSVLTALFFLCGVAAAVTHLNLKAGVVHVDVDAPLSVRMKQGAVKPHAERSDLFLVHVGEPITAAMKTSVNEALAPFHLGEYVSDNTFVVSGPTSSVLAIEDHPHVKWTGHLESVFRVQPSIQTVALKQLGEGRSDSKVRLVASLANGSWRFPARKLSDVEAIAAAWRADLPATVTVTVVSARRLTLDVPVEGLDSLVAALTSGAVHLPELLWLEAAPVFTYGNYFGTRTIQGGTDAGLNTVFWDAGLDGSNQTVAVSDSGLDYSSCFFNDPLESVAFYPETNPNHRKIISYYDYADATDDLEIGHGTHVVGSVTGNSNDPSYTNSDGLARNAKLFFTDIANTDSALFEVPSDLNDLFGPAYDVGARVHSNSWGAPVVDPETGDKTPTIYGFTASGFDDFMDQNRDFLILCAAGNGGAAGTETIIEPGTAKNVLTVGASQNTEQSFLYVCSIEEPSPTGYAVDCPQEAVDLILSNPTTYSTASVALFSSQGPLSGDARLKPELVAPGSYVVSARSTGEEGSNACTNGDGGVKALEGTSMATPLVAGAAVIVRQYFVDGFYPSGVADPQDSLNPPASLIKALLMNGARTLNGISIQSGLPLGSLPSVVQGLGMVDLKSTLYVQAIPDSSMSNILAMEDYALSTSETHTWCFDGVTAGGPVRVLLVWTDVAGSSLAVKPLVNNLNLEVTTPDGTLRRGNDNIYPADSPFGPVDNVNTYEFVGMVGGNNGEYCVTVIGANVPMGPQSYTLLVGGGATNIDAQPTDGTAVITSSGGSAQRPALLGLAMVVVLAMMAITVSSSS